MSHARQQIRDALATVLGYSTAGTASSTLTSTPSVYRWRAIEIPDTKLPAIDISSPDESVDSAAQQGDAQDRDLTLEVGIHVRAASGVDDTIDTLSAEIENAVAVAMNITTGGTLGALCDWCQVDSFSTTISAETQQTSMRAALQLTARYRVDPTDVETIL